jgi:hypothetical protein
MSWKTIFFLGLFVAQITCWALFAIAIPETIPQSLGVPSAIGAGIGIVSTVIGLAEAWAND